MLIFTDICMLTSLCPFLAPTLGPVQLMILDARFILSKACIFLFVGKISLFLQRSGFLFSFYPLCQGFFRIFETSLFPFLIPRKRE